MTTPSGTIKMSDVRLEIYGSATGQIDMNDSNVRKLAAKPSGVISMSDLKSKTWPFFNDIFAISPSTPVGGSTTGWITAGGTLTLSKSGGFSATYSLNGAASVGFTTGSSIGVSAGDQVDLTVSGVIPVHGGETVGSITLSGAVSKTIAVDLQRS